jgi:hypothetical protein
MTNECIWRIIFKVQEYKGYTHFQCPGAYLPPPPILVEFIYIFLFMPDFKHIHTVYYCNNTKCQPIAYCKLVHQTLGQFHIEKSALMGV